MKRDKKLTQSVWNIKESQFPKNGSMESKLKFLIRYAILASSGLNSQPWKFKIGENMIEVYADMGRGRPEVDPYFRELFISVGCALANLETAAKYFGMVYEKEYVDDKEDLVAILRFKNGKAVSKEKDRFGAITKRQVNREDYKIKGIERETMEILQKVNEEFEETGILFVDQKKQKGQVANLVYQSNKVWFKSKELVEEMEKWLQDDIEMMHDGLPTGMLNLYKLAVEVKYVVSRDSETVRKKAERDRKNVDNAAAIGVIWTKKDSRLNWVKAGELYERLALDMASNKISNAFFNTIVELKTKRKQLENICRMKGRVQMVIRMGYSDKEIPHSPRRPVEEVIIN
jgi:hypothetical protein